MFNLDASVSNDDLRQIFGAYGEVKEVLFCVNVLLIVVHIFFFFFFDFAHILNVTLGLPPPPPPFFWPVLYISTEYSVKLFYVVDFYV